jgi:hypothetical protein
MKLYLDDIRPAPSAEWLVARNIAQFKLLCLEKKITHISFDHDLWSGRDCYGGRKMVD